MRPGLGVDRIENVHHLTLKDNSVGTILILDTLEHVENVHLAMKEIYRVLKRRGMVIMSSVMKFPIHDYPSDYWRFIQKLLNFYLKILIILKLNLMETENFRQVFMATELKRKNK